MRYFACVIVVLFAYFNTSSAQKFQNLFQNQYNSYEIDGFRIVWKYYDFKNYSNSKKYGFQDNKNNLIIPYKYDKAGTFSENLAPVCIKKYWGFIDKTGKRVIPFKFTKAGVFSEQLAPVVFCDKLGFINTKGEWVINPQYYYDKSDNELITETGFSSEMAPVSDGKNWFYINKSGEKMLGNYRFAGKFRNGVAIISNDSTTILTPRYFYDNYNHSIPEGNDTLWVNMFALMNTKGEIIESGFDNIDTLPSGFFLTNKKGTYTIIGKDVRIPVQNPFSVLITPKNIIVDMQNVYKYSGEPLTKIKPSEKTVFYYFMADQKPLTYDEFNYEIKYNNFVPPVGKWYCYDSEFGYALKSAKGFKNIQPLINDKWIVTIDSINYGVINYKGEEIIPLEYSEIYSPNNNWLIIRKYDKVGLADLSGKIFLQPEYKYLSYLFSNRFSFSTEEPETQTDDGTVINRRYGMINSEGKIILPMKYQEINSIDKKNLLLQIDGQYEISNIDGQTVIVPSSYDFQVTFEQGVIFLKYPTVTYLYSTDGLEITKDSAYKWEISPTVKAEHNSLSSNGKYNNGGQWKITISSPRILELTTDSIAEFSECIIAYSSKGCYLVSFKGNAAGPYDGIIQPSSFMKDNWFEINNGGTVKSVIKSSGDTLFTEDYETGENLAKVTMVDWKYFEGGKTGIVDENANVLIEPLYAKLKVFTEFVKYNYYTGDNIGRVKRVVDLSQSEYTNSAYETMLPQELPVEIYKNDSSGFDFWGKKNKIMIKADSIEFYYPFYLARDTKSGTKYTISNLGVSPPFKHIMRFGAEDEIPFFLVNIGGECDTVKIEISDSVYVENPETVEMEIRINNYIIDYPYFKGGKFYFLSDDGQFINQNPYDNVKVKVLCMPNSDNGYYAYKDVSAQNSRLTEDALISVWEPIQVKIGNKWGLINKSCQEIIPAKYDSIKWENEQFLVFEPSKVYMLDSTLNPVFISQYFPLPEKKIEIEFSDSMNTFFIPFYITCQSCSIDTFRYNYIDNEFLDYETGEFIPKQIEQIKILLKGNRIGLVDKWGVSILANEYDSLNFFFRKNLEEADIARSYYELSSSDTLDFLSTVITNYETAFIKVKKNGLWGLSDFKGKFITPIEYHSIKLSVNTNDELCFILTKNDGTELKIDYKGIKLE